MREPLSNRSMKTRYFALALVAVVGFIGCRTRPAASAYPDCYEYVAQVLAMPSCSATVVERSPCVTTFKTPQGRMFYIGSPGAADEVRVFLQTLQDGNSYYLPEAFMQFLDKKKEAEPSAPATGGSRRR